MFTPNTFAILIHEQSYDIQTKFKHYFKCLRSHTDNNNILDAPLVNPLIQNIYILIDT